MSNIEAFRRRHLPHWDVPGATYFEVDPIVWTKNSRSLAITAEVVLSVGLPLS